jgi:PmbA protein
VSAQLFSLFLPSFFADNAQKGLSRLAGKLNGRVAPPFFELRSAPHDAALPGVCLLDGDGVSTAPLTVVKEGVFRHFLYNLESAKRDGVRSTGHASRSYSGRVGTSFHNCKVKCSDRTTRDLVEAFPRALRIVHLEGTSGCQPVSGVVSIGAQGFLCEHGEERPVEGLTLSTNFFEMLQRLSGVGSAYSDSFSRVKVPALALAEVAVSA